MSKVLLTAVPAESEAYADFLEDIAQHNPFDNITIVACKDILNFLPEIGDPRRMRGSMCYELAPSATERGIQQIQESRARHSLHECNLVPVLRDTLLPQGVKSTEARDIAYDRYVKLFDTFERKLNARSHLLMVPGENDYPGLMDAAMQAKEYKNITHLDYNQRTVELAGVKIAGLGGGACGKGLFSGVLPLQATVNEFPEEEIARRLKILHGVDVLISAIRPDQSEALMRFVRTSPLSVIICPAKNNYEFDNPRGESELTDIGGKCCIYVRPFETPKNTCYLIDLQPGMLTSLDIPLDIVNWSANERDWRRTPSRTFNTSPVVPNYTAEETEKPRLTGFPEGRSKSESPLSKRPERALKSTSGFILDKTYALSETPSRESLSLSGGAVGSGLSKKEMKAASKKAKKRALASSREQSGSTATSPESKKGWRGMPGRFIKKLDI